MTEQFMENCKRSPAYNRTYPKGRVSFSADTFVLAESFMLHFKFSSKIPANRKYAKRYSQL